MHNLSFDERVILTLYKKVFKENYPVLESSSQDSAKMTEPHIKAQKMCYLLKLYGLNVGGFHYSWNHYGPFSPGLLAQLRALDRDGQAIDQFYKEYPGDKAVFSDADDSDSLFMAGDKARVERFVETLDIPAHKDNECNWIELLGSLAFLSNSMFSGAPFEWVNKELIKRKPQYTNTEENKLAWDTLSKAGLLSQIPEAS